MMKKITLFIFVLAATVGFAQTSNYCDTVVTHLNIPAEVNSTISLTIENVDASSVKITAAATDINFLDIVGTPIAGGAATRTPNDTSVSGEISTILTYAGAPPTDVVLQFLQWRRISTGGATWQINDVTTPFNGDCILVDPLEDVSLSDLKVDGVTIADFSSSTTTYNIGIENATPVPQITTVTTTNPNATVGTITQASGVPGSATFVVTSEDTNVVETYTINFAIQVITELIGNGGFESGDFTDWDLTGVAGQTITMTNPSLGTYAANINNTVPTTASGIKSSNRGVGIVNPGDEVTVKFDARGSFAPGGVLFAEFFSEFSGGGASNILLGGGPLSLNADPEVWKSFEFTFNVGSDVGGGISLLFNALTGGGNSANVFIDNVSVTLAAIAPPTCDDGIQNQGETGIDCGGPCAACPTGNNVTVDVSATWLGYVVAFNAPAGTVYATDFPKPVAELKTTIGTNDITLQPNFLLYNAGDAFWSNGAFGNKIVECTTFVEPGNTFNGKDLTFSGKVDSNTLGNDSNGNPYQAKYFIKALNPATGYSDALNGTKTFDLPASGNFTVSATGAELATGLIVQYGFYIKGLNANPTEESTLGSIVVSAVALSTTELKEMTFKAYPNPTKDSWTVKTNNVNISSVQVYDISGKNVLSMSPNAIEVTIDATKLSKGLYFATVITEAGSESLKLIKN